MNASNDPNEPYDISNVHKLSHGWLWISRMKITISPSEQHKKNWPNDEVS